VSFLFCSLGPFFLSHYVFLFIHACFLEQSIHPSKQAKEEKERKGDASIGERYAVQKRSQAEKYVKHAERKSCAEKEPSKQERERCIDPLINRDEEAMLEAMATILFLPSVAQLTRQNLQADVNLCTPHARLKTKAADTLRELQ